MQRLTSRHRRCDHLFTMIEVLVVIAVILVLAALLTAAISKARDKAKMGRWEGYMRNERVSEKQILQLMFTEQTGSIVENHALGIDVDGYEREKFDAALLGNSRWAEGRWFRKFGVTPANGTDYLEIAYQDVVDTDSGEFTAIFWVKPDSAASGGLFAIQQETSPGVWTTLDSCPHLLINADNRLAVDGFTSTDAELQLPVDLWSMVAVVQADGTRFLYRFGESGERGTEEAPGLFSNPPSSSLPLRMLVGSEDAISTNLEGVLDEVVIYRRALNDSQLLGHFKMGQP